VTGVDSGSEFLVDLALMRAGPLTPSEKRPADR
jgi:hypothetical protein